MASTFDATLKHLMEAYPGLRFPREFAASLLRGIRSMKESTTYRAILEEGEAKGFEKGLSEGHTQGRVEEVRRLILLLGERRLGSADMAVRTLIEQRSLTDLEALVLRVSECESWAELLAG